MRSTRSSSGRLAYRLFAAATMSGAIALGLVAAPAQSSAGPAAPGWVTYPLPSGVNPALVTRKQVQGQRVGSGCVFSFTGRVAPGSPGREQDEVAFNAGTCQAVYAVGPIQHGAIDRGGGSSGNHGNAAAGRA